MCPDVALKIFFVKRLALNRGFFTESRLLSIREWPHPFSWRPWERLDLSGEKREFCQQILPYIQIPTQLFWGLQCQLSDFDLAIYTFVWAILNLSPFLYISFLSRSLSQSLSCSCIFLKLQGMTFADSESLSRYIKKAENSLVVQDFTLSLQKPGFSSWSGPKFHAAGPPPSSPPKNRRRKKSLQNNMYAMICTMWLLSVWTQTNQLLMIGQGRVYFLFL